MREMEKSVTDSALTAHYESSIQASMFGDCVRISLMHIISDDGERLYQSKVDKCEIE